MCTVQIQERRMWRDWSIANKCTEGRERDVVTERRLGDWWINGRSCSERDDRGSWCYWSARRNAREMAIQEQETQHDPRRLHVSSARWPGVGAVARVGIQTEEMGFFVGSYGVVSELLDERSFGSVHQPETPKIMQHLKEYVKNLVKHEVN